MLRLEQTAEQKNLKTVHLSYGYTLSCSRTECREALVFQVSVDILGHDPLIDDKLALGLDLHEVNCECVDPTDCRISGHREFIVAQQVLDEDIGIDEIKLKVNAVASTGESCSGTTGIVRGNF